VDIALQTEKSKKLNSERLARNPLLLARPQTFGLHQILRHVSSSEFSELEKYFEKADFTDVKVFRGETTLRKFIASMLSYYPWWIVLLYHVRKLLVGILGLVKHEAPEELPNLHPEDVSFNPGDNVTFFIVRCTKEESYWISETPADKHLRAYFGVVREPVDTSMNRFYVITTVFYKHWTGPIYFNLIRPFHHLVVSRMAKHGLKN
jgi:hypothetical protein